MNKYLSENLRPFITLCKDKEQIQHIKTVLYDAGFNLEFIEVGFGSSDISAALFPLNIVDPPPMHHIVVCRKSFIPSAAKRLIKKYQKMLESEQYGKYYETQF